MKRLFFIIAMTLIAIAGNAQYKIKTDKEAVKIMGINTASAVGQELIYKLFEDSIKADKTISMADVTVRHMEKMAELESRQQTVFSKNSRAYKSLLKECLGFSEDLNGVLKQVLNSNLLNSAMNIEMYVNCYDLLDQAKGVVKHAVVVGMAGKVPLPWNINLKDFLAGKDNTPIFNSSNEKTEKDSDGENLLTPDERYRIVNNAVYQLRQMRRALWVVKIKMSVDMDWRKRFKNAGNYCKKFYDDWEWAFKHSNNPFSSYPRL